METREGIQGSMNQIGMAIMKARETQNLSRTKLAERSGIKRQYVYKIETGMQMPNLETLRKLGEGLNIADWRLLRWARKQEANLKCTRIKDRSLNYRRSVASSPQS